MLDYDAPNETRFRLEIDSRITDGAPVIILHKGRPDTKALRAERTGLDDLMTAARGQGFRNFSEIDMAVLEPNGKTSFFAKEESGSGGAPVVPESTPASQANPVSERDEPVEQPSPYLQTGQDIPKDGEGWMLRRSMQPVAVSTVGGRTCRVSGICTHLGGILSWNDAEKSCDCPL